MCQSPGRAPDDQQFDCLQLHLHSPLDSLGFELLPAIHANGLDDLHICLPSACDYEPGGLPKLEVDNDNCSVLADAPGCAATASIQDETARSDLDTAMLAAVRPNNSSGSRDIAAKQNAAQKQGFTCTSTVAQTKRQQQSAPASWQRKLEINREAQKRFRQKQKVRPTCNLER